VEAIVKLALETPLELWMVQIAGMKFEVVSVHGNKGILEGYDDLHAFPFGACVKIEQGVLVEAELCEDTFQADLATLGHFMILAKLLQTRCMD
jgi:hypothetical protein